MVDNSIFVRIRNLAFILRQSEYKVIVKKIKVRLHSSSHAYCLRRDLDIPFDPPEAKIPLEIRPINDGDIPRIFNFHEPGLSDQDALDLFDRLQHIRADIPTCYVALNNEKLPTYIQWLMGYQQNKSIETFFNGTFPLLGRDEALLENALTLTEFRGQGIMPAAMARIAEKAATIGARWVITFVEEHNIASLKGCKRAGFTPYMVRDDTWFLFHRRVTFTKLPDHTPYPFDIVEQPAPTVDQIPQLAGQAIRI